MYGEKRQEVIRVTKKWAKYKGIDILEGHAVIDHIHVVLQIPPKYSVSAVVGLLKDKSASEVMSFGKSSNRMVRGRSFWARGYCVSTVGLDEMMIRNYVRDQEEVDRLGEQQGLF